MTEPTRPSAGKRIPLIVGGAAVAVVLVAGAAFAIGSGVLGRPAQEAVGSAVSAVREKVAPAAAISDVDLCAWARVEVSLPDVRFGTLQQESVPLDQQQAVRRSGETDTISCDVQGLDSSTMMSPRRVAMVTLVRNGADFAGAKPEGSTPYRHAGVKGYVASTAGVRPSHAGVAAQLESGIVLNVEAYPPAGTDLATALALGARPLMDRMIDAWTQKKVPRVPGGSYADAAPVCDRLDLSGWKDSVRGTAAGVRIVRSAQGGLNLLGRTRVFDSSDAAYQPRGTLTCGIAAVPEKASVFAPWNDPLGQSGPAEVSFLLERYRDASAAEAVVQHTTTAGDACTAVRRAGDPVAECADGSLHGTGHREAASGPWVLLGSQAIPVGWKVSAADRQAAADRLDDELASFGATLQAVDPSEKTADDPRLPAFSMDAQAPGGASCAEGDTIQVDRTAHATALTCNAGGIGTTTVEGEVDGVHYSMPLGSAGTCTAIDATKWGGPARAQVCIDNLTISVADGGGTSYFREYYDARWRNPQFGGD